VTTGGRPYSFPAGSMRGAKNSGAWCDEERQRKLGMRNAAMIAAKYFSPDDLRPARVFLAPSRRSGGVAYSATYSALTSRTILSFSTLLP
jgi:hypothetical protein